tara:strand:+ start:681 stop:1526 length:846 start_codon:yes stop_codon:yes gene_type:complete
MSYDRINSYAKINLALNVIGKRSKLHIIETLVAFLDLFDEILIKKIVSKKNDISFSGKFSKNINRNNTVSKLFHFLEKRKILRNQKFQIKIKKLIPTKSGLGGGSMNAASILGYLIKKKVIKPKKNEITKLCNLVGSDVILGLDPRFTILYSKKKIKRFSSRKKIYVMIAKPNFGCSTKIIYSKVKNFNRPKLSNPSKKMFELNSLIKMNNSLEQIALKKYPKLKKLKSSIEKLTKPRFVRMTGSGSALVAYFSSKKQCENAKKKISKEYKNYWCMASKTI